MRPAAFFCLAALLGACTTGTTQTDADTTGVVIAQEPPEVPLVAEQLVGQWANENGLYLDFGGDGVLRVTGRDQMTQTYRVLGDSLVVAAEGAFDVEAAPPADRYRIASLTAAQLVLAPEGHALAGTYARAGADTTGM